MIQFDAVRVSLPLKKRFFVSKGGVETTKTNVLAVMNNRYNGEAAGSVHYGPPVEVLESDILAGMELLRKEGSVSAETLEKIDTFPISTAARSALAGMVLHFLSGESQRYPWEILGLPTPVGLRSSITVGLDDAESMIAAIRSSEYQIVKVKMGNDADVTLLDSLGSLTNKEIRVDANGAWSCEMAEEMIFHLSQKGIRIIEQPTDAAHVKEWKHLKRKLDSVELIMDEGMTSVDDFRRVGEFVDGINIKMEKCGGILPALRLAAEAKQSGRSIMLGCMVESSVGIAQSVYMSSVADYHDLDGPLLLESDIARGITYHGDSIEIDSDIVGGPKLDREILQKYIQS